MTRTPLLVTTLLIVFLALAACGRDPVLIIGRPGLGDGEFREPRSVSASRYGLAVVDKSGRVQIFELDGRFRRTVWITDGPVRKGLPCGISWLADGRLALADTHQSQVTLIAAGGGPVGCIGEYGALPGQFLFPQRIDVGPDGTLSVTQYGFEHGSCIQVFDRDGKFLRRFGGNDGENGALTRPMGIVTYEDGSCLVADQSRGLLAFRPGGAFAGDEASPGNEAGSVLYGLCRGGDSLFATDLGLHRIVRLSPDGRSPRWFGGPGTLPGQFHEPWDVSYYAGKLYVADRMNHRVQCFDVDSVEWSSQ